MATIHPADQQLVSMIVNHLKTEGLFDQFRRDCLADVDTKPAYLHLRQRVDNFVSNHLSNHTWSPQLNKNQLRNTIRQLVLQSGMLEQGVDRIVAQVVDPKVHHTFRPQVERVVRRFLSPNSSVEDELPPVVLPALGGELETEIQSDWTDAAPACVSSTDVKVSDQDDSNLKEMDISLTEESPPPAMKEEELEMDEPKDIEMEVKEEDSAENVQKIPEEIREDSQKPSNVKQKTRDRLREEYSLEDSELEGLSDISVSSVHTSDLSSFEGDSEEEELPSDSTEEGEISSDGEAGQTMASSEDAEKKPRGVRQGYVHKPFLYSRYYSDSDDEVTVEERRRSAARDKEERLLKRQQNRERMEEKRRQRAVQREERDRRRRMCVSEQRPREKEARKEQKVLEKKVALSRQRRRDSRKQEEKKKPESEGISVNKDIVRQAGDQEERKKKINMDEKNPVHSFILDLELGTEERQRSCGKSAEERARHKPKPERRRSCDTVEKETKGAAEGKKGLKVKAERKSSVVSQEKFEAMDEASPKKAKTPLRGPDSTGSPEERSEVETGSEVPPRRDKHQKEMVKRSKSISEVKAEKLKPEPAQRSGSETESDGRKSDKNRVKTRENPLFSKALNRPQTLEVRSKAGVTEKKICDDKTKDSKAEKKTLQKKRDRKCVEQKNVKVAESSSGPAELSVAPSDDPYAALSDITPESDEDSTITQPRSLSAEADALLSLMDVRSARSDVRQESEADLIMKEAALTLLSMDPDVSRSDAVVSADNSPPEEVHLSIIQEASSQRNVTEESRDLFLMKDSDEHNREILTLETDSVKPMNITTPDGVSAERKQTRLADTESVLTRHSDTAKSAQTLTADSSHHAFSTVSLLAESAQTLLAGSVESEQTLDADTVEHVRTLDVVDTLDSAQRLDADIKVSAQTFSAVESAMTLNLETKSEQNHDTDVIEPERTLDSVTTECSRTLDANTIESSQTLNADSVEFAQTPDVESVRTPVALSVKTPKEDIVESVQTLDADTSGSAQINEANSVEGAQTLNAAPVVSLQTLDADPVESTATLNLDPVESAQTLDAQPVKSAATGNTDPVQSAQTDDADTVQTPADLKTEIVDETPLDLNDVPDTAIPKMQNVPEAAQTLETDHTPDLPADSPRPSQTHSTTDSARTSAQDQQEPTSEASETVEQVKSRRRNRSSIQRTSSAAHSALQDHDGESVEGPAETQKKLRSAAPLRDTNTVKPTMKRKRSSDALVITTAAEEMGDTQKPSKQKPDDASDVTVSVCADEEEKREEHKEEVKPVTLLDSSQNVGEPRKRRGRPCKIPASNTPDKCEKKEAEEEDEETRRRTTTRAASRLEAERNKSKPATRALSKRSSGEEVSTRPGRGRKRAVCSREDVAQKRVKR